MSKWSDKHFLKVKCPYNCIKKTPAACPIGTKALKKEEEHERLE